MQRQEADKAEAKNDALSKDIAPQMMDGMKSMSEAMAEMMRAVSGPKEVTLKYDGQGRPIGATARASK